MAKIKKRASRGLLKKHKTVGRSQKKKKNFQGAPELKEFWDPEKSGKANYESLGIRTSIDTPTDTPFKKEALNALTKNSEHVPTKEKLADWEIQIIESMIKKYRDDYKAMSKNIKINTWQWTANKIRKMIEKYNSINS
ncbi:unnamed protein product [Blepharisma stoltei]|uniref:Nucleolar protein 16 n=1 Tax=Blepharisma stoltei TaxID=1481888 RepID=A0AAU9JG30_9CILI|nr:unnamed protein product [Blepharisma stoltei]